MDLSIAYAALQVLETAMGTRVKMWLLTTKSSFLSIILMRIWYNITLLSLLKLTFIHRPINHKILRWMILILQKQIWTKWNMIKGEKSWKHCLYQVSQMEHTMFENILGVSKKSTPFWPNREMKRWNIGTFWVHRHICWSSTEMHITCILKIVHIMCPCMFWGTMFFEVHISVNVILHWGSRSKEQ